MSQSSIACRLIRERFTRKYSTSSWIATAASLRQSGIAEIRKATARPSSTS